jgi:phenylacetate-CoA ligase
MSANRGEQIEKAGLWNPKVERMSPDQMRDLQWRRLVPQVRYNYQNSPFYKDKMDAVGAAPDDIKSFDDFSKLPLTTKEEHRQAQQRSIDLTGEPYEMMACAPKEEIVRINATSGTTGTPTLYTLTAGDVDIVNEMHARKYWRAGVRPGDVMLQALSLSMFTGGLPLSQGIQHLGASVVPVGIEGGTQRVLDFLLLTKPTAMIATPSFGRYLIEKCQESIAKPAHELGLKWFFCAGEPGGGEPAVRQILADGFGVKVFDHTGGGHAFHGISCDCSAAEYNGMHFVSEDHCLLELVDPKSGQPVAVEDGAVGEMVWTFLNWRGGPLMRYGVGDIAQIWTKPCSCGMPGKRFKIIGRADDMLIVKGANIYPRAIGNVIAEFYPRVTGAFRIILSAPGPLVDPPLRIRIEYGNDQNPDALNDLETEIQAKFKEELRFSAEFNWLPPESLPREAMKTNLLEIDGA